MALGNLNFKDISENDLKELIEAEVPEGQMIDYKRDTYGNTHDDKKEFLKDVSSFANTFGGHIVIGMAEEKGVPTELIGVCDTDIDKEIQRFENLIRDGIEPRIIGYQIRPILLENKNSAIVIRIPRSWNLPHRVKVGGHNKFYLRNSSGKHEASVDELRSLFNLAANVVEKVRVFRAERLAMIQVNEGPVQLAEGDGSEGRLILHLVPLSAFGHELSLNPQRIYEHRMSLQTITPTGFYPQYNLDGFINARSGEQCYGYTQVFRNGIIEATKAGILREGSADRIVIPSLAFEKWIFDVIPQYLSTLKELDIPTPIVAMISLIEISGACLGVDNRDIDDPLCEFKKPQLLLPEIIIDDYGTDKYYQKSMRPAFDALWNAAGYPYSRHFNKEDEWLPSGKRK